MFTSARQCAKNHEDNVEAYGKGHPLRSKFKHFVFELFILYFSNDFFFKHNFFFINTDKIAIHNVIEMRWVFLPLVEHNIFFETPSIVL
jgi:hypothetical protein